MLDATVMRDTVYGTFRVRVWIDPSHSAIAHEQYTLDHKPTVACGGGATFEADSLGLAARSRDKLQEYAGCVLATVIRQHRHNEQSR